MDPKSAVDSHSVYRSLQKHLDRQAVGFPGVMSGVDLKVLQRFFSPEEARLATHLTYQPTPQGLIEGSAKPEFSSSEVASLLEGMFKKGAIGWRNRNGENHWQLLPLIVGMFEGTDGNPDRRLVATVGAYMKTAAFAREFISTTPPQMRTIPINASVSVQSTVAPYDRVMELVESARSPFVVLPCICRATSVMRGRTCAKTSRIETCLCFGDMASMVLRRNHGRAVSKEELREIVRLNEEDGLVFQPSNAQRAEFICACCGCCCGMLSYQKMLPHPRDFWATNYRAVIDATLCRSCGKCVERCQVKAIVRSGRSPASIKDTRCIGCGLCVTTCPTKAIRLEKSREETVPPCTDEELYDAIKANKKGPVGRWMTLLKVALRLRR